MTIKTLAAVEFEVSYVVYHCQSIKGIVEIRIPVDENKYIKKEYVDNNWFNSSWGVVKTNNERITYRGGTYENCFETLKEAQEYTAKKVASSKQQLLNNKISYELLLKTIPEPKVETFDVEAEAAAAIAST